MEYFQASVRCASNKAHSFVSLHSAGSVGCAGGADAAKKAMLLDGILGGSKSFYRFRVVNIPAFSKFMFITLA